MILRLRCYHPATMSHSLLPPAISTCITNIIYINLPSCYHLPRICYHPSATKSSNPLRPNHLPPSSFSGKCLDTCRFGQKTGNFFV